MRGFGATDSINLDFSSGVPVAVDPNTGNSVVLDFSQGYAAAPGAPGSVGPDGKIITGLNVAPATNPIPASFITVVAGAVGVLFLLNLVGGRRR